MGQTLTNFREEDLMRVRDFLVSTYKEVGHHLNWTLERWNFAYSMDRVMNGISLTEWAERTGIWERDGQIIGVVNAEGSNGDAFFHLGVGEDTPELLKEMFDFSEKNLSVEKDGQRRIYVHIPKDIESREKLALERGYHKTKWKEPISELMLSEKPIRDLGAGFTVKNGDQVTDQEKGRAHAKAFGYLETEYSRRTPVAYEALRKCPDYQADLDLYVVAKSGEIASFCTLWYDAENKIVILEPVGTNPDFRRQGLAGAVISEGLRRAKEKGAERAFVGSNSEFYQSLGFTMYDYHTIWEKTL